MKKLLSLILVLALAAMMGVAAFAEDIDVSGVSNALSDKESGFKVEERDLSAFAAGTSDIVTISGNTYTVNDGTVTYVLSLDPTLGYFVLTQDLVASAADYFRFSNPEETWQSTVDSGFHFVFIQNDVGCAFIENLGYDGGIDSIIGTLDNSVAEPMKLALMQALGEAWGGVQFELVNTDDLSWYRYNNQFFTFVSGNIIKFSFESFNYNSYEGLNEDDLLDSIDLISCLSISAN